VDILIEEFNINKQRVLKFGLFMLAFGVVTFAVMLEKIAGIEE